MANVRNSARRPLPANNFLEALQGLSKDVLSEAKVQATQAITADIPQSFGLEGGDLTANQSYSIEDLKNAEKTGENRAETKFNNRLQQERLLFLRSEIESKQQITAIQQEIQMLAKSAGELDHEVQVATFQAPVNPGVYHRNFFEHLKSLIKTLRQKVQESKNWLATQNSRAAKRNYYWGQVKSSGTKFLLSSERYMVTSTG